jgi:transcriptional regulator with XRE-family HTH domain
MNFLELQQRLLENLRHRIHSGQATERSLARQAGVSQPHLHNVLKGRRFLSIDMADEILRNLELGLFDLIQPDEVVHWHNRKKP